MNFKQSVKFIRSLRKNISILLIGPPGIGKSAIAKEVAAQENAIACVRDLCTHQPEDLLGAFKVVDEVSRYFPPAWLKQFDKTAGANGILILDDLGAASGPTQVATLSLVQDHRAGDLEIQARVIATTNRREDRSGAVAMPAAFCNKVAVITVTPDVVEWVAWARTQGVAEEVLAFVTANPTMFSQAPREAHQNGQFATPRSWTNLGQAFGAWDRNEVSVEMLEAFIGNVAPAFLAYLRSNKLYPDPAKVLDAPKEMVPKPIADLDTLAGLTQALGFTAGALRQSRNDIPARFLKALSHVTQEHQEFAAAGLQSYFNNGGSATELTEAAQKIRDKGVQKLVGFLVETAKAK